MPNTQMRRDQVKTGNIFATDQGRGTPGRKRYGAIGTNGKFASVNMVNGKLAFTKLGRADKKVIVVSNYNLEAVYWPPGQSKRMSRNKVPDDALFTIADGNNVYAHLDKNNSGDVVSLNLRTRDYAVGSGRGNVTIVGSYKMKGQAAA